MKVEKEYAYNKLYNKYSNPVLSKVNGLNMHALSSDAILLFQIIFKKIYIKIQKHFRAPFRAFSAMRVSGLKSNKEIRTKSRLKKAQPRTDIVAHKGPTTLTLSRTNK